MYFDILRLPLAFCGLQSLPHASYHAVDLTSCNSGYLAPRDFISLNSVWDCCWRWSWRESTTIRAAIGCLPGIARRTPYRHSPPLFMPVCNARTVNQRRSSSCADEDFRIDSCPAKTVCLACISSNGICRCSSKRGWEDSTHVTIISMSLRSSNVGHRFFILGSV